MQAMCREWETLGHSSHNGMSLSSPSSQCSRIYVEEEAERLKTSNDSKKSVSSRHNRMGAHVNSQKWWHGNVAQPILISETHTQDSLWTVFTIATLSLIWTIFVKTAKNWTDFMVIIVCSELFSFCFFKKKMPYAIQNSQMLLSLSATLQQ